MTVLPRLVVLDFCVLNASMLHSEPNAQVVRTILETFSPTAAQNLLNGVCFEMGGGLMPPRNLGRNMLLERTACSLLLFYVLFVSPPENVYAALNRS